MSLEKFCQRLPAITGTATPPFHNARSARDWLKLLPLINVPIAHAEMLAALLQLNQSSITGLDSLKIAEQFRESVHVLQDGLLNRYTQKPIPLTSSETQAWQSALQLWQALEHCYARCWHMAIQGEPDVAEYITLLAERTLYCSLKVNTSYILIHHAIPDEQWAQQFNYYQLAQHLGIEQKKAKDSLIKISGAATPEDIFIHSLLLVCANPYQYSLRYIMWISECLEVFSTRCSLGDDAQTLPNRQPFSIDFAAPAAPERLERSNKETQCAISSLQLAQTLNKRIKLLRSGETPEKIGLGTALSTPAAEALLVDLYHQWCDHPTERNLTRRETQKAVAVGFGLSNLHRWMAEGSFAPVPQDEPQLSSQELMQIRLFGQTSAFTAPVALPKIITNPWQTLDETASGLRLQRSHDGERVSLQQLLIIKDQQQLLIGSIRWLCEHEDNLQIGVQLLAGQAQAATIRAQDAARFGQTDHTEVLLMPAIVPLKIPNTLILPSGWFRQGRLLELWDGQRKTRIRLISILSRGIDYERIHFVASGGIS